MRHRKIKCADQCRYNKPLMLPYIAKKYISANTPGKIICLPNNEACIKSNNSKKGVNNNIKKYNPFSLPILKTFNSNHKSGWKSSHKPIDEPIYYIGFKLLLSRSIIQSKRFARPESVFASRYARVYVFFTDNDIDIKFV